MRLSGCCPRPSGDSAETGGRRERAFPQLVALALLSVYRAFMSHLLMTSCKFHPTCSAYAYEAIERHGVLRGSRLAAGRILRCRPFAPGGIDPVPERLGATDA